MPHRPAHYPDCSADENGRNHSLSPGLSSPAGTNQTHGRQDFVKCEMADTGS